MFSATGIKAARDLPQYLRVHAGGCTSGRLAYNVGSREENPIVEMQMHPCPWHP
jgi:hypothetical protein